VTVLLQQPATGAPVVQRAHGGTTLRETARAGVLYLALTLLLTWPLSFNPATTAAPGDPDTDLFVWTLAWNTHALNLTVAPGSSVLLSVKNNITTGVAPNSLGTTPFEFRGGIAEPSPSATCGAHDPMELDWLVFWTLK
jgi:hypothetical protein